MLKINRVLKILKKSVVSITLASVLISISSSIVAYAHSAYFLGVTVDTGNYKYVGTVTYDDALTAGGHKETKIGGFKDIGVDWNKTKVPEISSSIKDEDRAKAYDSTVSAGNGEDGLIYTFPGIHTTFLNKQNANGNDQNRAIWVSDILINNFNDALGFIMVNSGYTPKKDSGNAKDKFIDISALFANKATTAMSSNTSVSFNLPVGNGARITLSPGNDTKDVLDGVNKNDYIKVSVNNNTAYFIFKVQKGYRTGQELANQVPSKIASDTNNKDAEYLTWGHIALQGNYNYDVKNTTFQNIEEITKPNKLSQMLGGFFDDLLSGLRQLLGLYSFQELMLNQGARSNTYFYGIMPKSWFNSSMVLHVICQIIAGALILGALVKLLVSRNLASITTSSRVNLMEGAQDILITALMLSMIIPIFYSVSIFNFKLVEVFERASDSTGLFGASAMSPGHIASILISVAYFIVSVYFNFVYILRAITVSLLIATAPLFVVSVAFGGKYKQLFGNFSKELISNIFLQTFHSIVIAFFCSVSATGALRTIESLVLMYSFIPLTQFFRTNLMGLSGGFADKVAGNALATGSSMVMAGASGFINKTFDNKSGTKSESRTQTFDSNPNKYSERTKDSNTIAIGSTGNETTFANVSGGENPGEIPNAQVSGLFNKSKEAVSQFNQNHPSVSKGIKNGLSIGGNALKMGANAGIMIGASSIGDKYAVAKGAQNISSAMGGIKSSLNDAFIPTNGDSQELNDYKSQNDGYMYHNSLGNGSNQYHFNSEEMANNTGISGVYDKGKNMEFVYDYDESSGKLKTKALNGTTYEENFKKMYTAFKDKDEGAIQHYRNQGITGVYTNGKGQVKVAFDKSKFGYERVSTSGGKTIIEKSENVSMSPKDIIVPYGRVTTPTPSPQPVP